MSQKGPISAICCSTSAAFLDFTFFSKLFFFHSNCLFFPGSAVKEVLRQTSEFETRSMELLKKDLEKTDTSYVRELEEVTLFLPHYAEEVYEFTQ